jgi:hypothetical protein
MDSTSFERAKSIMDAIDGLRQEREFIDHSTRFECRGDASCVTVYARDQRHQPNPIFLGMQQAAFTVIDLEIARLKAEFEKL